jgi:hypothetical protein
MICIKQRDRNVDVQQRPHGSRAFSLDQFSDGIESDFLQRNVRTTGTA